MPNGEANGTDSANWDKPLIVAEPDVQVTTITDQDQFLLLACDGLFDVYSPEEIVQFVRASMEKHGDTQRCCQVSLFLHYHPAIQLIHSFLPMLTIAFDPRCNSKEKLQRQCLCDPDYS
jgi:hypothetical protein